MLLHNIGVAVEYIQNSYQQAPTTDNNYNLCRSTFELEIQCRKLLIFKALYGNNSAGCYFKNQLQEYVMGLKYESGLDITPLRMILCNGCHKQKIFLRLQLQGIQYIKRNDPR